MRESTSCNMFAIRSALLSTVALSFFSTLTCAQAQNDTQVVPAASTFYLPETETQFSVNVANDSSDVYIYFASPAYSWVGAGFGKHMENSLMLIMYPNANGDSMLPIETTPAKEDADFDRSDNISTHRPESRRASLHQQSRHRGSGRHKN